MSKRSRAIEKAKRRTEKFKRKQQKKDEYAKFAAMGKTKGSKRFKSKKKKTVRIDRASNRNRRTTYEVELTGSDGKKKTILQGGTFTPSRKQAQRMFGTMSAQAKRNA